MVRPTMMKTIIVVSQVSFQLGQVTFLRSRFTCWKNSMGVVRRAGGASTPSVSSVFLITSAITYSSVNWQERRDSNPRPSVLETDALPAELHSYLRKSLLNNLRHD